MKSRTRFRSALTRVLASEGYQRFALARDRMRLTLPVGSDVVLVD